VNPTETTKTNIEREEHGSRTYLREGWTKLN